MHTTTTLSLLSLLPLLAPAKDIPIQVGNGALRFNPENVVAAVGDTLSFTYFPRNHSVTQSSFGEPCAPLAGGFNSGFNPTANGTAANKFVVTVKDTKPIWVYCAQVNGRHCQTGMSMVVNQGAAPNTLDAYKAKAASQTTNSTAGAGVSGGVFVPVNGSAAPTGTNTATAPGGYKFTTVSVKPSSTAVSGAAPFYPYTPGSPSPSSSNTGSGNGTNTGSSGASSSGSAGSGSSGSGSGSSGSGSSGSGGSGSSGSGSSGSTSGSTTTSAGSSPSGSSSAPISFAGAGTVGKAVSSGLIALGVATWAFSLL